jgi:phenylacetate-coenzyme A ligase PaaK-like adenylate-forming protein
MVDLTKLHDKLTEVASIFPWYRQWLPQKAVQSISELPLMTASLLETFYYQAAAETWPCADEMTVYQTSGTSSGKRKQIVYSREDEARYLAGKTRLFSRFLRQDARRYARAVADLGTGHAASTALAVFARLGMEGRSIPYNRPIEEHVRLLRQFQPEVLYTMPSILEHVLLAAEDPAALGIQKVILVGETATPLWMSHAAAKLGLNFTDILDTYGSIELGTIAYYSHEHGRYLLLDDLWAEGIAMTDLPEFSETLPEGEQILVLTSFARKLFPAVRFVTYDVVRDLRPVVINGKQLQSFRSLVKRVGKELKHGEKISIYDIEHCVFARLPDARIRVEVAGNRLRIHVQSGGIDETVLDALRREIPGQIPEIGQMIENRLLDEIEVLPVKGEKGLKSGAVKNKKIYYGPKD